MQLHHFTLFHNYQDFAVIQLERSDYQSLQSIFREKEKGKTGENHVMHFFKLAIILV